MAELARDSLRLMAGCGPGHGRRRRPPLP